MKRFSNFFFLIIFYLYEKTKEQSDSFFKPCEPTIDNCLKCDPTNLCWMCSEGYTVSENQTSCEVSQYPIEIEDELSNIVLNKTIRYCKEHDKNRNKCLKCEGYAILVNDGFTCFNWLIVLGSFVLIFGPLIADGIINCCRKKGENDNIIYINKDDVLNPTLSRFLDFPISEKIDVTINEVVANENNSTSDKINVKFEGVDKNIEIDKNCKICKNPYKPGEKLTRNECGCFFHSQCNIKQMTKSMGKPRCIVCKEYLERDNRDALDDTNM